MSTTLKELRSALRPKLSQEKLARRANITLQTYRSVEDGKNCTYSTARAIFAAMNIERKERQMQPLSSIEDLELSIV